MKILLINPPISNYYGPKWLPLGLAYIAAVLEKDFDVKVIDLNVQQKTMQELIHFLKNESPTVVGFSAITLEANNMFKLIKIVKSITDAKIVVGGPHPSVFPEESLRMGADFVIRDEGEETIKELLKNLNNPFHVRGISYKKKGRIIHNPKRKLITDLDKLPFPARHLFPPLEKYDGRFYSGKIPTGTIITSRGCPYKCVFCYQPFPGVRFRLLKML
jgi:radical SAM superfamily enzyme YgiQ (UPF0313 family)